MTGAPAPESSDARTAATTHYWLIEERRWVRIACGIIGPLGLAMGVVWFASGFDAASTSDWKMAGSCVIVGALFTAAALKPRLLVPFKRTVETRPRA